MSATPCNDSEQLESSLLFGLAFEEKAKPEALIKFCNSACIKRLISIAKVRCHIRTRFTASL